MASVPYPYIDIAVMDTVRERLCAGDAVLIVDSSLDCVVFANGAGARMAGFDNPVDLTGSDPELGISAKRQIGALDFNQLQGKSATIALRITSGVESRMVMTAVSPVRLPDGQQAVMLSAAAEGGIGNAIDGLAGDGSHAAILDADGAILVSSAEFGELGIESGELARLSKEMQTERDRMIKRRIKTGTRNYPAGIGRINDQPGQFILLVIEDKSEPDARPVNREPEPAEKASTFDAPPAAFGKRITPVLAPTGPTDRWYFHGDRFAGVASTGGNIQPVRSADAKDAAQIPPAANETSKPEAQAKATADVSLPHRILIDPESVPVRFTWKIDAAGFFSMISPEFGETVGRQAADIEGRTFAEVAQVFAMDPSGEIRDLLERHDTWSGRSVLWPIEGTDLRAPVDLAALPVYDRERRFEGFRGFGIVRIADAEIDPEAIGLALAHQGAATIPVAESGEVLVDEQVTSFELEPSVAPIIEDRGPEEADDFVQDPWQGEKPALEISTGKFALPTGDKVIRLEERRQPRQQEATSDNTLSPIERSAFREIAERLRREGLIAAPASDDARAEAASSADAQDAGIGQVVDGSSPQTSPSETVAPDFSQPPVHSNETGELKQLDETVEPEFPSHDGMSPPMRDAETKLFVPEFDEQVPEASEEHAAEFAYSDANDEDFESDDLLDLERLDQPSGEEYLAESGGDDQSHIEAELNLTAAASQATPDEAPILARLPMPILVHNGAELLFANQAFFDLTGFTNLEALKKAGGLERLFFQADDRPTDVSHLNSMLRTAYDESVPVRAHLHSVPWKGGHALLLSMRTIDPHSTESQSNTDDQHDIAALEQEVSELSSVLETATDGVVFVNQDGTIRAITQSGEALFGFDPAEVRGKPFTILFATESQRAVSDYLSNLSGTGVASLMNDGREVIGREAHGRFIPLFMTIGSLSGSTGYCAVMRDITQWKRAEEELNAARRAAEHASSQKSEFLARVSHEIRTPLNAIIGFSDLMTEERFGPVGNLRYLDYLKDINRSGRHVLDLVNDLLDISKIEAGQQEMDFEAVSLNESLAEAVSMMQPQANRNRVIIRSSFASELPEVVADLRSVKQIALNLLSNAVRYTAAGGQVIVSTAYELTGGVVIRVRDTGIGMSAQEIEQAMKPFKQINALNRARGEGTGLGLPLTKAMVEANRANFTISSTPGHGTLVEITFPSTRVLAD